MPTNEHWQHFPALVATRRHRLAGKMRHEGAASDENMAAKQAQPSTSSTSKPSNPPQAPTPTISDSQTQEMSIPSSRDRFVSNKPLSLFGYDTHHGRFPTKPTPLGQDWVEGVVPMVNPYDEDQGNKTTLKRDRDNRNTQNATSPRSHGGIESLCKMYEVIGRGETRINDNKASPSSSSGPDSHSIKNHRSRKWSTEVQHDNSHLNTNDSTSFHDQFEQIHNLAMIQYSPSTNSPSHPHGNMRSNSLANEGFVVAKKKSANTFAEREEALTRLVKRMNKQLQRSRLENEKKRAAGVVDGLSPKLTGFVNHGGFLSGGLNSGDVSCEAKAGKNDSPDAREQKNDDTMEKTEMSAAVEGEGEKITEILPADVKHSVDGDIETLHEEADEKDWVNLSDDGTDSDRAQSPLSWEEWYLVEKGTAVILPVRGI